MVCLVSFCCETDRGWGLGRQKDFGILCSFLISRLGVLLASSPALFFRLYPALLRRLRLTDPETAALPLVGALLPLVCLCVWLAWNVHGPLSLSA